MATIDSLNIRIGASIDDFEAKMATVQKGIGRLSSIAQSAGQSLSTYVTLPLGLLAAGAIHAYGEIDSLTRGLNAISTQDVAAKGITGVAAIGQAATQTTARLAELQEIAKAPGIGFEQAVQGDIRLRAVGISAGQSASILKEFANAIALTGGGAAQLNSVTVQLGQMAAKGKVLAQDLRPIIEAAPAVATALQKLYGTVDSETISASLEKQGKSSKDFIASLTSALAEAPRVTGGIANTLENLQQAGTQSLAKLGAALDKAFNVSGKLESLANLITRLADRFATLSPFAQKTIFVFAGIAAAIGPLLFAVGSIGLAIYPLTVGFGLLGTAAAAAWAAITGPIGLALLALTAITAAIVAVIAKYRELHSTAQSTPLSGTFKDIGFGLVATQLDATGKAAEKTAGILEKLEAQLKAAKEARPALTSEADILASNKLIQSLEEQIKRLNELGVATDKMRAAYADVQKSLRDVVRENQALGNTFDLVEAKTGVLESSIKKLVDAGFSPFSREVRGLVRQLQELPAILGKVSEITGRTNIGVKLAEPGKADKIPGTLKKPTGEAYLKPYYDREDEAAVAFAQRFQQILANGLAGAAETLGTALGDVISGTKTVGEGLQAAFSGVLGIVGDFIVQYGKLLITQGTLELASTLLASNPFTAGAAIAVGIAAVAAGSAIKGFAGGGNRQGAGNLASSSANYSAASTNQSRTPEIHITAEFKLRGETLIAASKLGAYRQLRTA